MAAGCRFEEMGREQAIELADGERPPIAERRTLAPAPEAVPVGNDDEQAPAIGEHAPDLPQEPVGPSCVFQGVDEQDAIEDRIREGKLLLADDRHPACGHGPASACAQRLRHGDHEVARWPGQQGQGIAEGEQPQAREIGPHLLEPQPQRFPGPAPPGALVEAFQRGEIGAMHGEIPGNGLDVGRPPPNIPGVGGI